MLLQGLMALRRHMQRFLTFWKSCEGKFYYKHHMATWEGVGGKRSRTSVAKRNQLYLLFGAVDVDDRVPLGNG